MPPGGPPHGGKPPGRGGPSAGRFLLIARKQLGDPYTWGGASPAAGFDCSGLVKYALTRAGINGVPRTSEQQWAWVHHISAAQLRPGDLVFEQWPGDGPAPGHVAIYTGNGKIEEAPQPGERVHEVSWSPGQVAAAGGRIVGYGRVPGLNGALGAAGATLTGILSWPGEITGFFSSTAQAIDWLLQPSHWIRIIAGTTGAGNMIVGVWLLSHSGGEVAGMTIVPRPAALPLGIFLVGLGGVLLFVAFHNLPDNVSNFPAFLGYLQAQLRGTTAGSSGASGSSTEQPAPLQVT
jgi:hypothetical protein